jgi:hypothetical protein
MRHLSHGQMHPKRHPITDPLKISHKLHKLHNVTAADYISLHKKEAVAM